jgi:hypothetical protein
MAGYSMKVRTELVRALVEPELSELLRSEAEERDRSVSWTVHEILSDWARRQRDGRRQGTESAQERATA